MSLSFNRKVAVITLICGVFGVGGALYATTPGTLGNMFECLASNQCFFRSSFIVNLSIDTPQLKDGEAVGASEIPDKTIGRADVNAAEVQVRSTDGIKCSQKKTDGSQDLSYAIQSVNQDGTTDCTQVAYATAGVISGVCDPAANGQTLASQPTNLCTTGTPSAVSGTGPWTWTCSGTDDTITTDDAHCTANKAGSTTTNAYGTCGLALGTCATGTLYNQTTTGNTTSWLCYIGTPSVGQASNCFVTNGACDPTSDGQTLTSQPTNLCTTGTPSAISTSTTKLLTKWSWTCAGLSTGTPAPNPGATVSCGATKDTSLCQGTWESVGSQYYPIPAYTRCELVFECSNVTNKFCNSVNAGTQVECVDQCWQESGTDGSTTTQTYECVANTSPICNSSCTYKPVPGCASTCKNGVSTGMEEPIRCVDDSGQPCSTCTGPVPSYCDICG